MTPSPEPTHGDPLDPDRLLRRMLAWPLPDVMRPWDTDVAGLGRTLLLPDGTRLDVVPLWPVGWRIRRDGGPPFDVTEPRHLDERLTARERAALAAPTEDADNDEDAP